MTMSFDTTAQERDSVLELWAESIIEMHRFGCDADRVLSRWDENDVDALMPSSDELSDCGFDIVGLAKALEAGLNAELFGKAYRLIDITDFNQAFVAHGAGLEISFHNEELARKVDMLAECA
jgi:hypothetical protein